MKTLIATLNQIARDELGTRHKHTWQFAVGQPPMRELVTAGKPLVFLCECGKMKTVKTGKQCN